MFLSNSKKCVSLIRLSCIKQYPKILCQRSVFSTTKSQNSNISSAVTIEQKDYFKNVFVLKDYFHETIKKDHNILFFQFISVMILGIGALGSIGGLMLNNMEERLKSDIKLDMNKMEFGINVKIDNMESVINVKIDKIMKLLEEK